MKRVILSFGLLTIFGVYLFGASVIKVICDRDGENIYLNGKFKSSCDENEILRLLVKPGKYNMVVKKRDKKARYEYKKSFRIGDEVQKIIEVRADPVYSEYYYFQNAISRDNKTGCDEYLKRFPNGRYKKQIKEFLAYLRAKRDFNAVGLFKKRYPKSKYIQRLEKYYRDNPLIATLKYNNKAIYALSLLDDRYLYAGGGAERLLMWDIKSKKLLKNFPYPTNMSGVAGITTLDISPDRKHALSNGRGFREWDLSTGNSRVLETFAGPDKVKYLNNSTAVTVNGRVLKVLNINTSKTISQYAGAPKFHCSLDVFTLSKDKRYAYFGMYDDNLGAYVIKKYDIQSKKIVKIYKDKRYLRDNVMSLKLSPDGRYLICGMGDCSSSTTYNETDKTILIWDEKNSKVVKVFRQNGYIYTVDIDNKGKFLATGGSSRSIKIWDFKKQELF